MKMMRPANDLVTRRVPSAAAYAAGHSILSAGEEEALWRCYG